MSAHIVAAGGALLLPDSGNPKLESYCLSLARSASPRVLFIGTASGDDPTYLARFYESYGRLGCRTAHLPFFRRTPVDLRGYVLDFDVVHVGGGNTRSMLAVWREWGMDAILRDAAAQGVVLCGSSAGAICWFEEGVTDSLAGELTPMRCLGFLAGSACPHYDGEKERRPAYQRMVAAGTIVSRLCLRRRRRAALRRRRGTRRRRGAPGRAGLSRRAQRRERRPRNRTPDRAALIRIPRTHVHYSCISLPKTPYN